MDRQTAEEIFVASERALAALGEAEVAVAKISDPTERSELKAILANLFVEVLSGVRASALRQYPDIQSPEPRGEPDTTLDIEDIAAVTKLTSADITAIDNALLVECALEWRKVARVVGSVLNSIEPDLDKVPVSYFAQRVIALVQAGKLESQGDLHYIRCSEVRLPQEGVA